MTNQVTFSDSEYHSKPRQIPKEVFLARMDLLIPWQRLESMIEPHNPKAVNGHRPYPLATMLRIHCVQQWYRMSDPAIKDALYEIASIRIFTGLSLHTPIPDHSTILKFHHLLERLVVARKVFNEVRN